VSTLLGTLYPGYFSYKAIKQKDIVQYVRKSSPRCIAHLPPMPKPLPRHLRAAAATATTATTVAVSVFVGAVDACPMLRYNLPVSLAAPLHLCTSVALHLCIPATLHLALLQPCTLHLGTLHLGTSATLISLCVRFRSGG